MDLLVPEPVGFVQEAVQFLAFLGAMPRRLFLQGHLSLEPLQFLLRSFFAVVEHRMILPAGIPDSPTCVLHQVIGHIESPPCGHAFLLADTEARYPFPFRRWMIVISGNAFTTCQGESRLASNTLSDRLPIIFMAIDPP